MERIKKFIESSSPQKLFLCLSIPAILLFVITIPALQGFDEATHFLRAYQVSTGDFVSERFGKRAGGPIPINVSNMNDAALNDLIRSAQSGLHEKAHIGYYKTYLKENHPDKNIVNKYFAGSAVYSPVSYAPQSIGIFLARTLRLPLLSYIYIGRILNAAVFIALAYLAIRLAPKGKWALFAVAALPTTLTAASTLSPDALLNGAALVLVALFLKALFDRAEIKPKYILGMFGAIAVLSLTKQTYFILALLPLFLPPKRVYGSIKRYIFWNALLLLMAIGLTTVWYSQVGDVAKYGYLDTRPTLNVSPVAQEHYILHNPINYAGTLAWEILGHFNHQYLQLAGFLTWKGILMPEYIIFLIYLGLVASFLISRSEVEKSDLSLPDRSRRIASLGPLAVAAIIIIIIYTGLYIYFSTVKEQQIEGVQGRYFIPLIGLLLPAVMLLGRKRTPMFRFDDRIKLLLFSIFIIQTLAALFVITATNYIPNLQFV